MRLVVEAASVAHPAGLEIFVPGFRHDVGVAEERSSQVFIEVYEGKLQIHIWDGEEDVSHTVTCEPMTADAGQLGWPIGSPKLPPGK